MQSTSEYTATLSVKKVSNMKTNPDYELRLNMDDCTTIELKKVDFEGTTYEWQEGGVLKPFGAPFNGYDAFYFDVSSEEKAVNYDTKVGYCICDSETGACEGFYNEEVRANNRLD